jgi:protein required for attachment to host cells
MQQTWILVADGVRARLFARSADGESLTELEDFINPEGRLPGHAIDQDRPPRVMERMGPVRHAMEPHTSAREKAAERFAQELNDVLERGRVEHLYERLILAAPPRFLGTLQHALGKQVLACVAAGQGPDRFAGIGNPLAIGANRAPIAGLRFRWTIMSAPCRREFPCSIGICRPQCRIKASACTIASPERGSSSRVQSTPRTAS